MAKSGESTEYEGSFTSASAQGGLNPEDRKLLLITIIGTVAANLITVLIVALAFLTVRFVRSTHNWQFVSLRHLPRYLRWVFTDPLWVSIPAALLIYSFFFWQEHKRTKMRPFVLGLGIVSLAFFFLVAIGYASGLK